MASLTTDDAEASAVKMYTPSAYDPLAVAMKALESQDNGQRLLAKLSEIEQLLEDAVTSSEQSESDFAAVETPWSEALTPSVLSRKVYLAPNQQVDIQKTTLLNKLYGAESALLTGVQSAFLGLIMEDDTKSEDHRPDGNQRAGQSATEVQPPSSGLTKAEEYTEAYQGFRTHVLNETDFLTLAHCPNVLTDQPRPSRPLLRMRRILLEEFWLACMVPNAAEVYMLSRAVGLTPNSIKGFIVMKRKQFATARRSGHRAAVKLAQRSLISKED